MKGSKVVSLALGLIVFAGVAAIQTQAQSFNKKTSVTFNQPVAVPGSTLPAGTYTFTILDSFGSRNIVQIWNEDKSNLITTILAIPNYRLKPTGETVIEFSERPANAPQALKAWFYPGHAYGIEFVYPKKEALQIAQAANEVVPAEAVEPTPSTLRTVPLIAITPQETEVAIAEAFPPPAKTAEPVTVAKELPRTASLTPLIALLGFVSLLMGFGLRRLGSKPV
ncbi:MAG: hypothetical protein WB949_05670 [Candidatus Acidiferrales bacterium]